MYLSFVSLTLQDGTPAAEPSLFGRFATQWFPAMVDALIGKIQDPPEAGVHYLLLEACVTFLSWDSLFPVPPRGVEASQLMSYLVRAKHQQKHPTCRRASVLWFCTKAIQHGMIVATSGILIKLLLHGLVVAPGGAGCYFLSTVSDATTKALGTELCEDAQHVSDERSSSKQICETYRQPLYFTQSPATQCLSPAGEGSIQRGPQRAAQ